MLRNRIWLYIAVFTLFAGSVMSATADAGLSDKELLGKKIFFDKTLSSPSGQACAACHAPEVGWTGPDANINAHGAVYEGAVKGKFGDRKPPSAAYGGDSPVFSDASGDYTGGMFWDGRATGERLGDPLAEQAGGPFLNPVEQNNPSKKAVCEKVSDSDYADLFIKVWGSGSLDCSTNGVDETYDKIGFSIAAFERSDEVSQFSSRYDAYLKSCIKHENDKDDCAKGTGSKSTLDPDGILNGKQFKGLQLFVKPNDNDGTKESGEGGNCAACHPADWTEKDGHDIPPVFTDYTYDNLGVPKNPDNPVYMNNPDFIDLGLGKIISDSDQNGKMKVPTLRNVNKRPYPKFVKAFSHNGFFKSLPQIMHFYNTRDVSGAGWKGEPWPQAEVKETVNKVELGNLGLTPQDESNIVAFLKTLSDGYGCNHDNHMGDKSMSANCASEDDDQNEDVE